METTKTITINGDTFGLYISKEQIEARISQLAEKMQQEYGNEKVSFLCVLNGAFVFAADLLRAYKGDCEISFIRLSSYQGSTTTGSVKRLSSIPEELKGKNIMIVEDIVDTGITMDYLLKDLQQIEPKSLRVCCLFDKVSRRRVNVKVDYVGFPIEDKFIVGYGLDYDQQYRNLPEIFVKE